MMITEESLLKGVVDFHVHSEPSFMSRACDFVELCMMASKAGYKAIGHKDHNYGSAAMASIIKKYFFKDDPLTIVGSFAMNETVGGMNPMVLETQLTFGAKAVWLPTTSAANHIEFMATKTSGFPKTVIGPKDEPTPVHFIDEDGNLSHEVIKSLEILKQYPGVAIGSGHGDPKETDAIIRKAVDLGIADRVFADHPYGIVLAPWDDIKKWADMGVKIEFVAGMTCGDDVALPLDDMAYYMKEIGPEKCILVSDLGMKKMGNPIEGFGHFLMQLHRAGISEDDIRLMTSYNTGKMIGLE